MGDSFLVDPGIETIGFFIWSVEKIGFSRWMLQIFKEDRNPGGAGNSGATQLVSPTANPPAGWWMRLMSLEAKTEGLATTSTSSSQF